MGISSYFKLFLFSITLLTYVTPHEFAYHGRWLASPTGQAMRDRNRFWRTCIFQRTSITTWSVSSSLAFDVSHFNPNILICSFLVYCFTFSNRNSVCCFLALVSWHLCHMWRLCQTHRLRRHHSVYNHRRHRHHLGDNGSKSEIITMLLANPWTRYFNLLWNIRYGIRQRFTQLTFHCPATVLVHTIVQGPNAGALSRSTAFVCRHFSSWKNMQKRRNTYAFTDGEPWGFFVVWWALPPSALSSVWKAEIHHYSMTS